MEIGEEKVLNDNKRQPERGDSGRDSWAFSALNSINFSIHRHPPTHRRVLSPKDKKEEIILFLQT